MKRVNAQLAHRLGLSARELAQLAPLDTPQKVQAFVARIPSNHEPDGETVFSARSTLRHRRAHCIEGAFVAALALWLHGDPPLLLHMDCDASDYPHVIALFRRGRCWGAISKTNGVRLRYRDPVYRSVRELAMSYFHEYNNKRGERTLRSISRPYDLRRIDPALWVTSDGNCWWLHDRLAGLRHVPLLNANQVRALSKLDALERSISKHVQYPKPNRRG